MQYYNDQNSELYKCIKEMHNKIDNLCSLMKSDQKVIEREFFSVKEVAKIIDRSEFTVREYCRKGRINAEKCDSGRGSNHDWKISSQELNYYKNHGLRPVKYG